MRVVFGDKSSEFLYGVKIHGLELRVFENLLQIQSLPMFSVRFARGTMFAILTDS